MQEVYDFISRLAENKNLRIVIMANPTQLNKKSLDNAIYKSWKLIVSDNDVAAVRANKILKNISIEFNNVLFLDRKALFGKVNNLDVVLTNEGYPFSLDGRHISIYGSRNSAEVFSTSDGFRELKQFLY